MKIKYSFLIVKMLQACINGDKIFVRNRKSFYKYAPETIYMTYAVFMVLDNIGHIIFVYNYYVRQLLIPLNLSEYIILYSEYRNQNTL